MQAFGGPIENLQDETTEITDTERPETTTPGEPEPEIDFIAELQNLYSWYLSIHDRTNADLRWHRLDWVRLIEEYYERIVDIFSEDMVALNMVAEEYRERMAQAVISHEGMTECLEGVQEKYERKLSNVNGAIRECARYANASMSALKDSTFYPVLDLVQMGHSFAPLGILSDLSRANIMTEQARILEYVHETYNIIELGWNSQVEQNFAWEKQHFEVKADFLIEELTECSAYESTNFVTDVLRLVREIDQCEAAETTSAD